MITEQFNIKNMDFNNKVKHNVNIFNKELFNLNDIYNKILKDKENVNEYEIQWLDGMTSVVRPKNKMQLKIVVFFYSKYYPENSMNWLDVSMITDMYKIFKNTKYNGDISKWDVSNVTDMDSMFMNSQFNKDIS